MPKIKKRAKIKVRLPNDIGVRQNISLIGVFLFYHKKLKNTTYCTSRLYKQRFSIFNTSLLPISHKVGPWISITDKKIKLKSFLVLKAVYSKKVRLQKYY